MSSDPSTPSIAKTPGTSTVTIVAIVLLCLYWTMLFAGTHVPLPQGALPGGMDKKIHFVAYAGLGVLLMAVHATRGFYSWYTVLICWLALVGYGVFDEVTQLLVNRQCELYDWLYDVAGAGTGLLAVTLAVWCFRPKTQGRR